MNQTERIMLTESHEICSRIY